MSCSFYETNYGIGSDYCHAKKAVKERDLGARMQYKDWKLNNSEINSYKCNCSNPRYSDCPYYRRAWSIPAFTSIGEYPYRSPCYPISSICLKFHIIHPMHKHIPAFHFWFPLWKPLFFGRKIWYLINTPYTFLKLLAICFNVTILKRMWNINATLIYCIIPSNLVI